MVVVPLTLTTDAGGVDQNSKITTGGVLHTVVVNLGTGGTALASGVDITLRDEDSGAVLLTLTNVTGNTVRHPRVPVHSAAGAEIAGAYTAPYVNRRVLVSVADGGNAKTGTLFLVFDR